MNPGDKKVLSFMVYASEKLDQWNILCNSEEDRFKWQDAFIEGLKAVPQELSRDYERMNSKRMSLKKTGSSKKNKRLTRSDVCMLIVR